MVMMKLCLSKVNSKKTLFFFVKQNLPKMLLKHTLYIRLKTVGQEKDGNGASHKPSKKVDQGYIRGLSKKFKSPESGRRKVLKSWTRWGWAIQSVIKFLGDTVITLSKQGSSGFWVASSLNWLGNNCSIWKCFGNPLQNYCSGLEMWN